MGHFSVRLVFPAGAGHWMPSLIFVYIGRIAAVGERRQGRITLGCRYEREQRRRVGSGRLSLFWTDGVKRDEKRSNKGK